ncbi:MAG: DUF899 domain-containing protein [Phycisphaerales bacterium]|nr:DUF899 domain-containing protein [Phycisphaerales bacterium]
MAATYANEEVARLEQAVQAAKAELTKALRSQPPRPVRDYSLRAAGTEASVQLSELFGSSRDLLVVHNMGRSCVYCTTWADGFASMYKHLASRCAFVLTTPDAPDVAAAFSVARGWTFPVVSHAGTSFAKDLGFVGIHGDGKEGFMPGISALRRNPDGTIVRSAARGFGPGDDFCAIFRCSICSRAGSATGSRSTTTSDRPGVRSPVVRSRGVGGSSHDQATGRGGNRLREQARADRQQFPHVGRGEARVLRGRTV